MSPNYQGPERRSQRRRPDSMWQQLMDVSFQAARQLEARRVDQTMAALPALLEGPRVSPPDSPVVALPDVRA